MEELTKLEPFDRLRAIEIHMERHRVELGALRELRVEAVQELRASGFSVRAIAEQLGVDRQAIYKLLTPTQKQE